MPVRSLDAFASAFFVLFGAWLIYRAWGYGITTDAGPGSGTFPFVAGLLVMVFSFLNLVKYLTNIQLVQPTIERTELVQIGTIVALIWLFTEIVDWLGMFLPLPFLLVAISLCVSWRVDVRWLLTISAGSIAFSVICYLIFDRFLNVLLPTGPLGF